MAKVSAPVVIGTSLLDSQGKVKSPAAVKPANSNAGLGNLVAGIAAPKTGTALSAGSADSFNGLGNLIAGIPTPTNFSGQLGPIGPFTANSATAAKIAAKGKTTANSPSDAALSNWTPLQFAAALRQATKQSGSFDASAFQAAIDAANQQAQIQRHQARRQGAATEADLATLYGHLGNFINMMQNRQHHGDTSVIKDTRHQFNNTLNTINDIYSKGNAQTTADLAARGLHADLQNSRQGQDFATSQLLANKGTALTNEKSNREQAGNLFRQSQIDARETGTGKVASAKEAVNTELENIASALAGQLGGINSNQATAESAYNTQLRSLAGQLMTANAAQDPNSVDQQIKLAQLAKLLGDVKGGSGAGAPPTNAKGYAAALEALTPAEGAPKGHRGTLTSIFDMITNRIGPFAADNLSTVKTDTGSLAAIMNDVAAEIKSRKGQGYGTADQQALRNAILIASGLYSGG